MTNAELNEAVARKLKGWTSNCKCVYPLESAHHNCPGEFGLCHHADTCSLPAYSTSIEAAWEIVEKQPRPVILRRDSDMHDPIHRIWTCEFLDYKAQADTAPLAICLAFLKLP